MCRSLILKVHSLNYGYLNYAIHVLLDLIQYKCGCFNWLIIDTDIAICYVVYSDVVRDIFILVIVIIRVEVHILIVVLLKLEERFIYPYIVVIIIIINLTVYWDTTYPFEKWSFSA